jgi:predicted nucleotidyltransferase
VGRRQAGPPAFRFAATIYGVFSVESRDRVRDHVLALAEADDRVVSGAAVGSFARGTDDRWSDVDLTFAIPDSGSVHEVLDDWTRDLAGAFDAVHLFDWPVGRKIYRVFLLPGSLQVDISIGPASEFRSGPGFELLFGHAADPSAPAMPNAQHEFGMAVHHAVRARICIERGRFWQAEYWIGELRNHALSLACIRRGLNPREGRGLDDLPADVLDTFKRTLVHSVERSDLLDALGFAVDALLSESGEVGDLAQHVEGQLRELSSEQ